MAKKLSAQVQMFVEKAKRRQLTVFKNSAQEVVRIASIPKAQGGRMPKDFGALQNSIVASTEGIPNSASDPPELLFAAMRIGDTVWIGWAVKYARRQEYGFFGPDKLGRVYSQKGNHFMTAAVQQWPQIVDRVTREVRRGLHD